MFSLKKLVKPQKLNFWAYKQDLQALTIKNSNTYNFNINKTIMTKLFRPTGYNDHE